MNIKIITDSVFGFLMGGGIIHDYRCAKNVQQGQTDFMAYKQAARINNLINFGLYVFRGNETPEYSFTRRLTITLISYPIPFALQILNHRVDAKVHPTLKACILAARNNLESVAVAVDVLLGVYFATQISPAFGVAGLVGLTIEVLKDQQLLSPKIKEIWEKAHLFIIFAHLITVPLLFPNVSVLMIADIILNIGCFVWEHYFEKPPPNVLPAVEMTVERAKEILNTPLEKFRVNLSHLAMNPKLADALIDVDIVAITESLIKGINWTDEHYKTFKLKLLSDARFVSENPHLGLDGIPDEVAKQEFEKGARIIAKEIAGSCISHGDDYIRYNALQRNLKAVLKKLSTMDDPADDLFKLAIEGGAYCASGKVNAIQQMYEDLIQREASLDDKFLLWLHQIRQQWFTKIYAKMSHYAFKLPKGIFDPSDIHLYDLSLFYFDQPYKIHDETLRNDMAVNESGLCNYAYRRLLTFLLDHTFWPYYASKSPDWYAPQALVNGIVEGSIASERSGRREQEWWQNWIDQLPDTSEREELDEELILFQVLDEPIYTSTAHGQALNPNLIKLMLCRMGIIEVA